MVPRTPILHGFPGISETFPRSDWTLSNAIDTVHLHTQPLSNPMPMNSGAIVSEVVLDNDRDSLPILSVCYGEFQES